MTVVAKYADLESGTAHRVIVDGVAVAVVRIEDEVFVIADRCSHADVSLSEGTVWCDTKQIECIKHGSSFSLVTGNPDTFPATQPVAVYNTEVVNGDVVVTLKESAK
jgi:3-phenylpropionate/trans-cinnamate dioxygenase ferredoxin subunit